MIEMLRILGIIAGCGIAVYLFGWLLENIGREL